MPSQRAMLGGNGFIINTGSHVHSAPRSDYLTNEVLGDVSGQLGSSYTVDLRTSSGHRLDRISAPVIIGGIITKFILRDCVTAACCALFKCRNCIT